MNDPQLFRNFSICSLYMIIRFFCIQFVKNWQGMDFLRFFSSFKPKINIVGR
jgi:hypothetical protein